MRKVIPSIVDRDSASPIRDKDENYRASRAIDAAYPLIQPPHSLSYVGYHDGEHYFQRWTNGRPSRSDTVGYVTSALGWTPKG